MLEDNPDDVLLVRHELEKSVPDLDMQVVDNLTDFEAKLTTDTDVVLSDFELVGFNAFDALEIVQRRAADVPVIIISGAIREEIGVDAMKRGAADYLIKDRLARLGPAIERALSEREIREEKNLARLALQESEERFSKIFYDSPSAIAVISRSTGDILDVNGHFLSLFGYTRNEVVGNTTLDLGIWSDKKAMPRFVKMIKKDGSSNDIELILRKKNGTPLTILGAVSEMELGGQECLLWMGQDVTQRTRAEAELRDSEALYSKIFYESPAILVVSEIEDSRIVDVNNRFTEILGYTREEVIGASATDIRLWKDGEQRKNIVREIRSSKSIVRSEIHLRAKHGVIHALRLSVVAIVHMGKQRLLWMAIDMTKLTEAMNALETERAFLDSIIENIPSMVFVKDAKDLKFIRYNKAGEKLVGFSRDDVIGKSDYDFVSEHEADLRAEIDRNVLKSGKLHEVLEESVRTHGNGTRIFRTRKIPITDKDGKATHLLSISDDITEQKEYEAALIKARNEAEELTRLKSAFLTNMSHEIRTPLSGIIGFAQVLADEISGEHQEHAILIKQSGQRLLETLNSVLDLSMLEAGALKLKMEALDVGPVVRHTSKLFTLLADRQGLDFRLDITPSPALARLDRVSLDRILYNVIGNAIKFTEKGFISVSTAVTNGLVEIKVRDTGIGISASFIPELFVAFRQESSGRTRSHEGIGMGLAISKQLIDAMHGEIHVESKKGLGTTFTISFPELQEKSATRPLAPADPVPGAIKNEYQIRVLAVDDYQPIRFLLGRYLRDIPEVYAYDLAADDMQAIEKASTTRYDVILMDVNLRCQRNGEDVMNEIRHMPAYGGVPFIAVTAYALPDDRERFLSAGFDGYLAKPVDKRQLRSVMLEVLAARTQTQLADDRSVAEVSLNNREIN